MLNSKRCVLFVTGNFAAVAEYFLQPIKEAVVQARDSSELGESLENAGNAVRDCNEGLNELKQDVYKAKRDADATYCLGNICLSSAVSSSAAVAYHIFHHRSYLSLLHKELVLPYGAVACVSYFLYWLCYSKENGFAHDRFRMPKIDRLHGRAARCPTAGPTCLHGDSHADDDNRRGRRTRLPGPAMQRLQPGLKNNPS